VGLFAQDPRDAWRVDPTVGVPEIDGADRLEGIRGVAVGAGVGGTGAIGGEEDDGLPEPDGAGGLVMGVAGATG
jgi:hypothetical protein